MAVSSDVMEVVRILDEEGFGVLAGELLAEINLGTEIEREAVRTKDDGVIERVPIPEGDQLARAMTIIRLRLVEPARKLAEAEEIAGRLSDGPSVRIRFIDPEEQGETALPEPPSAPARPGERDIVDQLDRVLDRVAAARRTSEL